jgi:hypothetical protein
MVMKSTKDRVRENDTGSLKTRARWKETPTTLEHTGVDGGSLEIIHSLLEDIDARQRDPRMIEHQNTEQKP